MRVRFILGMFGLFGALALVLPGCNPEDKSTPKTTTTVDEKKTPDTKHSGWWCREHGIPEGECLMCKFTEDELKKKGDWCDKHDRAQSQCFKCDPKLREKYAVMYRAKYGKEPPPIEDDEDEKKDDKKDEKKDPSKEGKK